MRKMRTVQDVEDNVSKKKTEMSEACGSLDTYRNSRKKRRPPRPLHINATAARRVRLNS